MNGGTALSIGNFDGVHLGHVALVRAAREAVGPQGRVVVVGFEPHPVSVLRPAATPGRLSRLEQRRRWLVESGADDLVPLPPTRKLLASGPERFIRWIFDEHRPRLVVEGPDFRFGKDRLGSVDTLRELGERIGFETRVIEHVAAPLADQHVVRVSSTMVRWLLERGRVGDAGRLLGRPYELEATVVPGDRKGRELRMPTANLSNDDGLLLPADGVYAGVGLGPDGAWYPAAVSVGTKPTFGSRPRVCETHLVGYRGPLDDYGWTLTLRFGSWLRDQISCPDVDALVRQMQRDVARTVQLAAGRPAGSPPVALGDRVVTHASSGASTRALP